jgi:hypothetical protein
VIGLRNLLLCQLVAKGPVSASPSPDHHQGDEVGIVEHRPVGVGEAVAQLAPLVDAAGGLGCGVAADPAGKGELLEEALEPCGVLSLVGIHLGVRALEVGLGQHRLARHGRGRR